MPDKEKKPSILERYGLRYFNYLSRKSNHEVDEEGIHVLDPGERKAMFQVQRQSIIRQAVAGGISAAISVLIGFWLYPKDDYFAELTWEETLWYYAWLYPVTFAVTAVEILYLYYDGLRSVHKLSTIAGLNLFPKQGNERGLATYLVRAALELPNPPDDLEGIDPRREVSKFRLFVAATVYKLKATATNFFAKAILRRMVGRSAFRALMEFVAVPVYAFWNGLIAYWVIRQARIRAMGESAVEEFSEVLYENPEGYSEQARIAAFQAIGAAIVRTVDLHPNLILFMEASSRHLGDPGDATLDNSELFIRSVLALSDPEKEFALRVFVVACLLDGRIAPREKRLMREVFERCGFESDLSDVNSLLKMFVKGQDFDRATILNCLPPRKSEA